jgi:hypothetical protein
MIRTSLVLLVLGLLPPVALGSQTAQIPPRLIKMFNSATIPLNVFLYSAKGNKSTITIKGREAVTFSSNAVRAEICTKGHPCSSKILRNHNSYSIVEDPKVKIWVIVESEGE